MCRHEKYTVQFAARSSHTGRWNLGIDGLEPVRRERNGCHAMGSQIRSHPIANAENSVLGDLGIGRNP